MLSWRDTTTFVTQFENSNYLNIYMACRVECSSLTVTNWRDDVRRTTPGKSSCLSTHPNKRRRKPADLIPDLTEPPITWRHGQHSDDVTRLETQLLRVHGHVVPQRFCKGFWYIHLPRKTEVRKETLKWARARKRSDLKLSADIGLQETGPDIALVVCVCVWHFCIN